MIVTIKRRAFTERQTITANDVDLAGQATTATTYEPLPLAPKSLDDLLVAMPGLRKLRSLDQEVLRALLNRAISECTWCAKKLRRTRIKWCSQTCLKLFQSRCCSLTQRSLVKRRDAGICKICGRDTIKAEREFKATVRDLQLSGRMPSDQEAAEAILGPIRERLGYARGHWREVDHVLPVTEGGGLCPISELRLLCGKCHAGVTGELIERRTAK